MTAMTTTATNATHARQATRAERKRARAIGISALLVMVTLTVAITLTALTLANRGGEVGGPGPGDGGGNQPPPPDRLVFGLPVAADSARILKDFSETNLQFNETLRQWRSHRAIAIGANAGTPVIAPYGGVVQSVRDTIYGMMVEINHENGLTSVFKSLDTEGLVRVNQRLAKGDQIGYVGTTSRFEFTQTPHVRVELLREGRRIDPHQYIDFSNK